MSHEQACLCVHQSSCVKCGKYAWYVWYACTYTCIHAWFAHLGKYSLHTAKKSVLQVSLTSTVEPAKHQHTCTCIRKLLQLWLSSTAEPAGLVGDSINYMSKCGGKYMCLACWRYPHRCAHVCVLCTQRYGYGQHGFQEQQRNRSCLT